MGKKQITGNQFCIIIVVALVLAFGAIYVRLRMFETRLTKRLDDVNISIDRFEANIQKAIDNSLEDSVKETNEEEE